MINKEVRGERQNAARKKIEDKQRRTERESRGCAKKDIG